MRRRSGLDTGVYRPSETTMAGFSTFRASVQRFGVPAADFPTFRASVQPFRLICGKFSEILFQKLARRPGKSGNLPKSPRIRARRLGNSENLPVKRPRKLEGNRMTATPYTAKRLPPLSSTSQATRLTRQNAPCSLSSALRAARLARRRWPPPTQYRTRCRRWRFRHRIPDRSHTACGRSG